MKKLILILAIMAIGVNITQAQIYVSGSLSSYNGLGTFNEQFMPTFEVGKLVNNKANNTVGTVGLAIGKTSFTNSGTTYVELRPSVVLVDKGVLSVSTTVGLGYLDKKDQRLLIEYCLNLNYNLNKNFGLTLFAGQYHFNGVKIYNKYTFTGLSTTFTFNKKN